MLNDRLKEAYKITLFKDGLKDTIGVCSISLNPKDLNTTDHEVDPWDSTNVIVDNLDDLDSW